MGRTMVDWGIQMRPALTACAICAYCVPAAAVRVLLLLHGDAEPSRFIFFIFASLLELQVGEVELSEVAGCLLSALLIRLMRQSQEAVEPTVVLLNVLSFKLLTEGCLRAHQTILNEFVVVFTVVARGQFDVVLDLCHHLDDLILAG